MRLFLFIGHYFLIEFATKAKKNIYFFLTFFSVSIKYLNVICRNCDLVGAFLRNIYKIRIT